MRRRILLVLLVALAVLGTVLLWRGDIAVPDRWNPWTPLDLRAPPNILTGLKLARIKADPALCRAVLATAGMNARPVPDRKEAPGCAIENAVAVSRSGVAFDRGFVASCRLAVAFALFERHVLQPAAEDAFGERVAAVEHLGTYACRNVNHRAEGRRSRHATADAIDLAAVRLAGGRRITVARGWAGDGPEARFLRRLRDRACRIFDVVLSPDYNAAHRDHLHLDVGWFGTCR
ncbi:extensin family protein [Inquilinus limosus]|uniref:extensin-like domain-containing protein n=1 Tax=Inquilinus limosus TaxID=171674 RepID=UPI003F19008B